MRRNRRAIKFEQTPATAERISTIAYHIITHNLKRTVNTIVIFQRHCEGNIIAKTIESYFVFRLGCGFTMLFSLYRLRTQANKFAILSFFPAHLNGKK